MFVQAGNAFAIVKAGSDALQVLDFAVTPSSAVPAAGRQHHHEDQHAVINRVRTDALL